MQRDGYVMTTVKQLNTAAGDVQSVQRGKEEGGGAIDDEDSHCDHKGRI